MGRSEHLGPLIIRPLSLTSPLFHGHEILYCHFQPILPALILPTPAFSPYGLDPPSLLDSVSGPCVS